MSYTIFMLIALPLLAIGWIAYAIWMRKIQEEEKKTGRPVSKHLKKTRSEVSDWAKKMAQFQPPKRKKRADQTIDEGRAPPLGGAGRETRDERKSEDENG